MASAGIEDGVLDGIEGGAGVVGQTDADGIRPTIDYHGMGGGKAVENGGGIVGDLGGGEAETGGKHGVYLKVCGRAGDGVVDTVLGVDDAGNLLNGRLNAWAELIEQLRVAGE